MIFQNNTFSDDFTKKQPGKHKQRLTHSHRYFHKHPTLEQRSESVTKEQSFRTTFQETARSMIRHQEEIFNSLISILYINGANEDDFIYIKYHPHYNKQCITGYKGTCT